MCSDFVGHDRKSSGKGCFVPNIIGISYHYVITQKTRRQKVMNRGRSSFKKVTVVSLALLMTFTTLTSFSTTEVRAATASTTAVAQEDSPFVTGGRIRNTETVSLTWDVPLTEDTAPVSVATTIATNPGFLGFDTSGIDPDVLDCVSTGHVRQQFKTLSTLNPNSKILMTSPITKSCMI